ncbi:MAG TPA: tetratricopeptide repeat protein [Gemmatimonadales bacterium]|nr:tetratricopeptide repeat protein [Gemmatimonadales bacterium]
MTIEVERALVERPAIAHHMRMPVRHWLRPGRGIVVALALIAASALALAGQDAQVKEPKRPKLDAGRDTNSAAAYYQWGMDHLTDRPEKAADAFYWSARLEPSGAEPWYGRWAALLLTRQHRDMFALMSDDSRSRKENGKIDSLKYEALAREPLLYTKLDAVLVRDFFQAISQATDGEVNEVDLAMTPDPELKGWLAYGSGRFDESVKQYAIAIGRKPKEHGLHAGRARAFIPLLQYDSAAAEFEAERKVEQQSEESTLVRVYNSKEMLQYSIGRVRETQDKRAEARDAYGQALVENLAFYPAHMALARMALASIDTTAAMKECELAAQLAPKRADVLYFYGVLLMTRRNFDEAAEQFRLAVDADPYFVRPYFPLAYIREGQGKDSVAIAYYTQFIALAPAALAKQVEDARQRLKDVKQLVPESH